MSLFPSGNGCRAPNKAFVSLFLLLVVGIIPERSEAYFCFNCERGCHFPNDNDIKACSGTSKYCMKVGKQGSPAFRSCLSTVNGDCFLQAVGSKCYDPIARAAQKEEIKTAMAKCIEAAGGPPWTVDDNDGETCVCKGGLSNVGKPGMCIDEDKLQNAGPVEGSGLMCYKCQGSTTSDCAKFSSKTPTVKCPDWKLERKIYSAACFKSRGNGMIYRDCGFRKQADCRNLHFVNPCTLTKGDLFSFKNKQDVLQKKINDVKACETSPSNEIDLLTWYWNQDRIGAGSGTIETRSENTDTAAGNETVPGNKTVPLVGPVSVVGAIGAFQGDMPLLPENYKDCICTTALCNPAGHPSSRGIMIFAMVILATAVLNREMFIHPA